MALRTPALAFVVALWFADPARADFDAANERAVAEDYVAPSESPRWFAGTSVDSEFVKAAILVSGMLILLKRGRGASPQS